MRGLVYLIIGAAFVGIGAYGLSIGYGDQSPSTAGVGWIGVGVGAISMMFGAANLYKQMRQKDMATLEFIPTAIENRLLLHAMGAVSIADKKVLEVEMQTISTLYRELLGIPIQVKEIMEIVPSLDPNFNIVDELSKHASKVRPEMKETIVKACYRIMISDRESAPSELSRIGEIGEALGIDPQRTESLLSEMNS